MSMWRWFLFALFAFVVTASFYCYMHYGNCVFFGRFLWQPKQTGSVAPTSRVAANELIQPMLAKVSSRYILEVGAGTGPVTEVIVEHLHPNDRFDVVEVDDILCKMLKDTFGQYKQLNVHCVPIEQWNPGYQYDVIISTVPLTNLTAEQVEQVLRQFEQLLKPEGVLSYLEYIGGSELKKVLSMQERSSDGNKIELLKRFRDKHDIKTASVLANIPPTYVHHITLKE